MGLFEESKVDEQWRTAMVIAGAFDVIQAALNEGGMKPEDVIDYPMPAMEKGGKYYVPTPLEYFSDDFAYAGKVKDIYAKYDNVYKYDRELFNLLEGKPEAQFGTQDYYATMSNVVQESFSKKDTDSKTQLDNAAKYV
ncbi:hypothetical protein D3C76_289390 [compost metagenome]